MKFKIQQMHELQGTTTKKKSLCFRVEMLFKKPCIVQYQTPYHHFVLEDRIKYTQKIACRIRNKSPTTANYSSGVRPRGKRMLSSVKTNTFLQLFVILIGHNKLDVLEAIINLY